MKLSGGTLVKKSCHDFDILGWLIGSRPVRVTATGGNSVYKDRETIDHAALTAQYENGIELAMGVGLFSKVHCSDTTLVGTEGVIDFPRGGTSITLRLPGKKDQLIEVGDEAGGRIDDRGVTGLHREFLGAVRGGQPPRTSPRVGRDALMVPIAAEQAIRERRVIELGA